MNKSESVGVKENWLLKDISRVLSMQQSNSCLSHILDNHHKEGELNSECFLRIRWALDICCADIGSHDLQDWWLNIWVCYSLYVTIPNWQLSMIDVEMKLSCCSISHCDCNRNKFKFIAESRRITFLIPYLQRLTPECKVKCVKLAIWNSLERSSKFFEECICHTRWNIEWKEIQTGKCCETYRMSAK